MTKREGPEYYHKVFEFLGLSETFNALSQEQYEHFQSLFQFDDREFADDDEKIAEWEKVFSEKPEVVRNFYDAFMDAFDQLGKSYKYNGEELPEVGSLMAGGLSTKIEKSIASGEFKPRPLMG